MPSRVANGAGARITAGKGLRGAQRTPGRTAGVSCFPRDEGQLQDLVQRSNRGALSEDSCKAQRWTAKRRSALVLSTIKGEARAREAGRKHGQAGKRASDVSWGGPL